jgi:hypothetical protein
MKNFIFTTNNNSDNSSNYSFRKIDYSKVLNDIINDNIIDNNKYITDAILAHDLPNENFYIHTIKNDNKFIKAMKFLSNYNKFNIPANLPFKIGKIYKLSNGTPIIFYKDEIQIGFDLYSYDDFTNIAFAKSLTPNVKKTIIEIYTNSKNIEINL